MTGGDEQGRRDPVTGLRRFVAAVFGTAVAVVGTAGGAILVPVGASAAAAGGDTRLDCRFVNHVAFTPGISPEVKEIRIVSTEPGPLHCTGTWAGQDLAGTGVGTFEGDAVGACAASTIDATLAIDHPLAGGERLRVEIPVRAGRLGTVVYSTGAGPAGAGSTGATSLAATATPDEGQDCVRTPITGITAEGRLAVVG